MNKTHEPEISGKEPMKQEVSGKEEIKQEVSGKEQDETRSFRN